MKKKDNHNKKITSRSKTRSRKREEKNKFSKELLLSESRTKSQKKNKLIVEDHVKTKQSSKSKKRQKFSINTLVSYVKSQVNLVIKNSLITKMKFFIGIRFSKWKQNLSKLHANLLNVTIYNKLISLNKKILLFSFILIFSITALITYLLLPKLPEFVEPLESKVIKEVRYPITPEIAEALNVTVSSDAVLPKKDPTIPASGRLVIPSIGVDADILEGSSLDVLSNYEGVWREPQSGNPQSPGSNMVIAGHRFQYLPPNRTTFYYLDRLNKNEKILVYWNDTPYLYEVISTRVVSPYHVEVRNRVDGMDLLTIYTCTPIGSDSERIVIQAKKVYF